MARLSDEVIRELNWVSSHTLDLWVSTHIGDSPKEDTLKEFGVDSENQLNALIWIITHEKVSPMQLDAALGDGEELTRLVLKREQPFQVTFQNEDEPCQS